MKTQQEIERDIMGWFQRNNSKVDSVMNQRWLEFNYIEKLNPKERELVQPAISNLIEHSYLSFDGSYLRLAKAGYNSLYQAAGPVTIRKVKELILNKFRSQKSKVGHIVPIRWINGDLVLSLNPEERISINEAVQELIDEGLVEYKNDTIESLSLTQKGFDYIYQ